MTENQSQDDDCMRTCGSMCSYPCNLPRTFLSKRTLTSYHQTLNDSPLSPYGSMELFEPDEQYHCIFVLDTMETTLAYKPLNKIRDINGLSELMNETTSDPKCRFIFIHAGSSRSPLDCSKMELQHVLGHHRIMPSFLEHVFTFRNRIDPHLQASFRAEDFISPQDRAFEQPSLGRSGLQIQHCFNLIGVAYDQEADEKYLLRQAAAYYSFDPIGGQSTWLILKADTVVRDGIMDMVKNKEKVSRQARPESSFTTGLRTLLLMYEWCLENWTPYLNFIECKVSNAGAHAKFAPVDALTNEPHIEMVRSRKSTFQSETYKRQNSGNQTQPKSHIKRTPRSVSWRNAVNSNRNKAGTMAKPAVEDPIDTLDFDVIFQFDALQDLYNLAEDLQNVDLVLEQNRNVMENMTERFRQLEQNEHFKLGAQTSSEDFETFFRGAQRCLNELKNQQIRLRALQATLERRTALFDGILQFKNMRTGEYFANHAKVSTDNMELLTVKTKQETVSIHVITILTLLFLPSTFVAVRYGVPYLFDAVYWGLTKYQTFFGSDILQFEGEETGLEPGSWRTRWGALRLFGIICGPLTGIVLLVWGIVYLVTKKKRAAMALAAQYDEEKGSYEDKAAS